MKTLHDAMVDQFGVDYGTVIDNCVKAATGQVGLEVVAKALIHCSDDRNERRAVL